MAKIDYIESISDRIGATTIAVLPKRCSFMRNWHSTCKACLKACPHDAIKRSIGHLDIDSSLCTNCGACVAACPTSTFLTTAPSAAEIVREARLSAESNEGHAVFACAGVVGVEPIDTSKVAMLPCLDYLDEYLLSGLFALGIQSATLLRGDCERCEVGGPAPRIDETVRCAKQLLGQWQAEGHVRLTDRIPSQVRPSRKAPRGLIRGQSRRDSFQQAGGSVVGYVAQAVSSRIDAIVDDKPPAPKSDRVLVRLDEVFEPDTYRSVRMLHMLDRIGTHPDGQRVQTRFWADVRIDPSACRFCGLCANMCATRALRFEEDVEAKTGTLTFRPSHCVNCRLCKESCPTHSMVYTAQVLTDDLAEDVVRVLFERESKKKSSMF